MFREVLRQKMAGIAQVTDAQAGALEQHYELLLRWNRVLNLTSIDSEAEAVERHYCESIFLALHLPPGPLQIADVGSGAGFPGIPVAVLRPKCSVTLIESHKRKAVFLREATRSQPNVVVIPERVESLRGNFDFVVSRAVRYEDLASALKNLSKAAELLTGAEMPPEGLGFTWQVPIKLPWGRSRFLRIGVSRETEDALLAEPDCST